MSNLPYEKINIKGLSRTEWLKLRQTGIGGSDAPVIYGVNVDKDGNQYKTADKLIEEKLSITVEETANLACRHGTFCEPFVAELFTEATGLRVQKTNFMYRSKKHPFMLANIDRKVIGQNAGLECKTTNIYNKNKYFDSCLVPANDDNPCPCNMEYYTQIMHYMTVMGWDTWYLAVLIGNKIFKWYTIERDERNINMLIEAEKQFYEELMFKKNQRNNINNTRSVKHA